MEKCLVAICLILCLTVSCQDNSIPPGTTGDPSAPVTGLAHTARVETRSVPLVYEAVGTIRPLTESVLESRVASQILKVNVAAGERVEQGQLLVQLDNRHLLTRLRQAREGEAAARNGLNQALKAVDEARAGRDHAQAEYKRTQSLFEKHVVASQKLDLDKAAFLQARARLEQAQKSVDVAQSRLAQAGQVVKEAEISLEYTRITAPADGVVVRRHVDPGDQAPPGKPLLTLQTSGALQLEAQVREGMMPHIRKGHPYAVRVATANIKVTAVVEEVIPYADPQTRTFVVKATLPHTQGLYPGMFGRLMVPFGSRSTLVMPQSALTRIGQLETVMVKSGEGFSRVYVTTGRKMGNGVEVLSGLTQTDVVGW